jgi:membrane protein
MPNEERSLRWAGQLLPLAQRLSHAGIPGRAAQMAFYFFLSVFPSMLILVAVLSQFSGAQAVMRRTFVQQLAPVLPPSIYRLLSDLLGHLAEQPTALFTWGGLVAIWAASSGMVATIAGLNHAYAETELRSWWKRRLVGIALTLTIMLAMTMAVVLLTLGIPLAEMVAQRFGLEEAMLQAWHIARWPATLCFAVLAFDLLYRFGPDHKRSAWRLLPVETLVAMSLWLVSSFALKFYMVRFGNYGVIYGALGGVIVLLLWFYLTAAAILTGAHVAAHIGHCCSEASEHVAGDEAGRLPDQSS